MSTRVDGCGTIKLWKVDMLSVMEIRKEPLEDKYEIGDDIGKWVKPPTPQTVSPVDISAIVIDSNIWSWYSLIS